MQLFTEILLFVIGLVLLIFGGDWFVDGASKIAHRFHMPEILIGATVVSIGTTIPEVMVSAGGALAGGDGGSAIAYGNAIGSIICNTSLIAAITMTFNPSIVPRKSIIKPILCFFAAAAFYVGIAYTTGYFSRTTGIILLLGFLTYMTLCVLDAKKEMRAGTKQDADAPKETTEQPKRFLGIRRDTIAFEIGMLVVGAAIVAVGADLLVDNGTLIAEALGVPHTVIALTFVALGTSLPELVTAITSLVKGHSDLSLGNIIGANLFNLVLVSGVATTIAPFKVPCEKLFMGYNTSFVIEIPVMLAVMLLMCLPALSKGRVYRWQGITLLLIYAAFCAFQFI